MLSIFLPLFFGPLVLGDCNADNCLRAFRSTNIPNRIEDAKSLCTLFVTKEIPVAALPIFAVTGCKGASDGEVYFRVSSACSCISQGLTSPATTALPSTTSITTSAPLTASVPTTPVVLTTSSLTTSSLTTSISPIATEPCALVRLASASQRAIKPSVTPFIPAELAYQCLNSVPLARTEAMRLVDTIKPYVEWQSDTAWKKNPPSGYLYPPHDIFASLEKIRSNLQANFYASEYQFQIDLYDVFLKGHDGHFIFYPDAIARSFDFVRQLTLVSVSSDGFELPKIKMYNDILSSPSTAPSITEINGVPADEYIEKIVFETSNSQDPDAGYNAMFNQPALVAANVSLGYFTSGGRSRYIYPGPNTTYTFDNGTTITLENKARVKGNWRGVNNGATFYQYFCTGPQGPGFADSESLDIPNSATLRDYPKPLIKTGDDVVSGYYLNSTGLEDVAVLALLSFQSEVPAEFQGVAHAFLTAAVRDGKNKLVIDLSGNGGGYILQAYDMFRLLFPDIVQDGFTRFRESETMLNMAQIFRDNLPRDLNPRNAPNDQVFAYSSSFNWRFDLNLVNQPFSSYEEKFSPMKHLDDNFTNIIRWDPGHPLSSTDELFGLGIEITGYGNRQNFTQPFKPEDIIMLTDGFCASACTLFAEFMRIQAGVKVITVGGRPSLKPMQAVGGVKGANVYDFNVIRTFASLALSYAKPAQTAILSRLQLYPILRSVASACNTRDNILRPNLADGTPAQYIYEPADCRLFFTAPMITNVSETWKAAADAAFNGGKCVHGALPKRIVGPSEKEGKREIDYEVLRRGFAPPKRGARRIPDAMWTARHGRKVSN